MELALATNDDIFIVTMFSCRLIEGSEIYKGT